MTGVALAAAVVKQCFISNAFTGLGANKPLSSPWTGLGDKTGFIVSSVYLNLPPQCWHWSPTQPGKHTQLPVTALHCPFIHGLSHSFASVKPGSPESSTTAESSSAVVSINKLLPGPEPEPERAHLVAPYILSQKMAAWGRRPAASWDNHPGSCQSAGILLIDATGPFPCRKCSGSLLKVVFPGYLVSIISAAVSQRCTEPHIDVQKWRYGNGNAQPQCPWPETFILKTSPRSLPQAWHLRSDCYKSTFPPLWWEKNLSSYNYDITI